MFVIFCFCDDCGLKFPKGKLKHPYCPRCDNRDLWEANIPDRELTLSEIVANELFQENFRDKLSKMT